jgi:hypothetical protein
LAKSFVEKLEIKTAPKKFKCVLNAGQSFSFKKQISQKNSMKASNKFAPRIIPVLNFSVKILQNEPVNGFGYFCKPCIIRVQG